MNDTPTTRLEKLQQRQAKLAAEIAREQKAARERERVQDARRKILVGAAILSELEAEPHLRGMVQAILKRRLTQERDRDLLADLLGP